LKLKIIALLLLAASLIAGRLWMIYDDAYTKPIVEAGGAVLIEIEKGDSLSQICAKLKDRKVDVTPFEFKAMAVLSRTYKKIKTGEYELPPGATLIAILMQFAQGKTKQYAITFTEGWTLYDLLREITANPNLDHSLSGLKADELWLRLLADDKIANSFLLPATGYLPEGLFFPDTYFFEKHMTDASLLERAYIKMCLILDEEWRQRAANLPFQAPYEALILASIVEKETAHKAERPLIAGVFIKRLQHNMLLQTDPTVIYGMGEKFIGNIQSSDLKAETPYNTYLIKGLPPTPIAMPGRDAIHAVLHPADNAYLYFVARGDGTHVFSETLNQHNKAVALYQKKSK
jgi:UPF0755 protein